MPRTILVTGGTSGIGRATAERFVADGARVVVTGRRPELVESTAEELGVTGVVCHSTDSQAVQALAARFDTLDVLINAAGGLGSPAAGATELETVLEQWRANLEGNLLSAVLTTTL